MTSWSGLPSSPARRPAFRARSGRSGRSGRGLVLAMGLALFAPVEAADPGSAALRTGLWELTALWMDEDGKRVDAFASATPAEMKASRDKGELLLCWDRKAQDERLFGDRDVIAWTSLPAAKGSRGACSTEGRWEVADRFRWTHVCPSFELGAYRLDRVVTIRSPREVRVSNRSAIKAQVVFDVEFEARWLADDCGKTRRAMPTDDVTIDVGAIAEGQRKRQR